jgi:hypothetical protein
MITQLLPPTKHKSMALINLRLFDMILFLRNDNIMQLLMEKKLFILNAKITEGIRKVKKELYKLFKNDHVVDKE